MTFHSEYLKPSGGGRGLKRNATSWRLGLRRGAYSCERLGRSSSVRTRKGRGKNYMKTLKEVNTGHSEVLSKWKFQLCPLKFASSIQVRKGCDFFKNNFYAPARTWPPLGRKLGFGIWSRENQRGLVQEYKCWWMSREPITATKRQEQRRLKVGRKFCKLPVAWEGAMAKHHPDLIFCRKQAGVGEAAFSTRLSGWEWY